VTLDDPERGNPLTARTVGAVLTALDAAEQDPACRALLLDATGPRFCCGLDLTAAADWLAGPGEPPPWRLFHRLAHSTRATVAIVDGAALGGGVALAAACDLVLVGAAARFRFTEVLLGLIPAVALPFVARRTGVQPAFRLALTAAEVDAGQALTLGLADEARERAADAVPALLRGLRRVTPDTIGALKALRAAAFPLPAGLADITARALRERLHSQGFADRVAGLRAARVLR
jgi:polyketide biosynthesis enoyl-CoA hydratase PksH